MTSLYPLYNQCAKDESWNERKEEGQLRGLERKGVLEKCSSSSSSLSVPPRCKARNIRGRRRRGNEREKHEPGATRLSTRSGCIDLPRLAGELVGRRIDRVWT